MKKLFHFLPLLFTSISCAVISDTFSESVRYEMMQKHSESSFKQVVSLVKNQHLLCTATLINHKIALTTANCMYKIKDQLEEIQIEITNTVGEAIQTLKINDWIMPQQWDGRIGSKYDIALIALNQNAENIDQYFAISAQDAQAYLMRDVKSVSFSERDEQGQPYLAMKLSADLKIKTADPDQIDAISENDDYGACIADNGSPLLLHLGNQYFILGLSNRIAFDDHCANDTIGHYNNIYTHLTWIRNNTTNGFIDGVRDLVNPNQLPSGNLGCAKGQYSCDHVDNNCDGQIDEPLENLVIHCQDDIQPIDHQDPPPEMNPDPPPEMNPDPPQEMNPDPPPQMCVPTAEVCDHADNNCDGQIDNRTNTVKVINVGYDVLASKDAGCNGPVDPAHQFSCHSAVNRYCANGENCTNTGLGIAEMDVSNANVVCVDADIKVVSMAQLTQQQQQCDQNTKGLLPCQSAQHRYCISLGYTAGFGPIEDLGDQMSVVCVPFGQILNPSIDELTSILGECTAANIVSNACRAAVSRYCVQRNFVTGFGPVETPPGQVTVVCL